MAVWLAGCVECITATIRTAPVTSPLSAVLEWNPQEFIPRRSEECKKCSDDGCGVKYIQSDHLVVADGLRMREV